jgi:tRNA nucleotidyltransferase/poly(A) polymerase
MAEAIVARLKFEKDVVKKVGQMVRNHMKPHNYVRQNVNEKTLRRFVREVGESMVESILDLAEADQLGNLPPENLIPGLRERIDNIMNSPVKVQNKPVLDGREIMNILDLKPGPKVGEIGKWLLEKADEYASSGKELTTEEAKRLIKEEM